MRASSWPTGAQRVGQRRRADGAEVVRQEPGAEQRRQLRSAARRAAAGVAAPTARTQRADTAFGHFARHHDAHQARLRRAWPQPAARQLRPGADRPRRARRAVPRARRVVLRCGARQQSCRAVAPACADLRGLRLGRVLARRCAPTRDDRCPPHGRAGRRDHRCRPRATAVGDGLPETLEEVVAALRPSLFQAQGRRAHRARRGAPRAPSRRCSTAATPLLSSRSTATSSTTTRAAWPNCWRQHAARRRACSACSNSILFIEQPIARKHALERRRDARSPPSSR